MRFLPRFALPVLLVLVPLAAQAASYELLGFGTYTDPRGSNSFGTSRIDVGHDNGYGAGVNVVWSDWLSTELAASTSRSRVDALVTPGTPMVPFGMLRMMPVTATAQFHFLHNSRIDPYVGAGAAYVHFSRLQSSALSSVSVDSIRFKNRTAALANAGLNIGLVNRVALLLDAKYIPIKAKGSANFTTGAPESLDLKLNPLIVAAGLRFRF
jgi:outer membrane protein W